jgi:hypothetical protein
MNIRRTNPMEAAQILDKMEAKPWWHYHRWQLRWWDLTAPIRIRTTYEWEAKRIRKAREINDH